MSDGTLTAIATVLLVFVGAVQIAVLISQKRQTRIALLSEYRRLWNDYKIYWGNVIFIGRNTKAYYQVLDNKNIKTLEQRVDSSSLSLPTIWALESAQKVFGTLNELSIRILQGHLMITDVYPIFGTEFLRHSVALRRLLDSDYSLSYDFEELNEKHAKVRREIRTWLIYHAGLRRRCLILIDLLWAEAAYLEDLPPDDLKQAAEAKKKTGSLNKKRVYEEAYRLGGLSRIYLALRLRFFLGRSEYRSFKNPVGINVIRLSKTNEEWTKRLLK